MEFAGQVWILLFAEQESESKFLNAGNVCLTLHIDTVIVLADAQIISCFLVILGGFGNKMENKIL